MYSEQVLEHFRNPHNMKELHDADGIGKVGNPVCGDLMWIYIKVGKNKNGQEYIKDIGFKTFGCVAAIATSSMLTDLAKGKTLKAAKEITNLDVAHALGDLPKIKMHCSNLAADGLHKAIENYEKKKGWQ
ncbi:iron-sulfur cluster assembly scaffold protein [Candidatus Woesearchaeota archaeon]|nr:iron-sulfur cluster assembly scaffold protein [Candidatus Woesearchaeota archaeon]